MRKPKKLTALLLALTLLFACAACANGNSTTDTVSYTHLRAHET